MRHSNFNNTTSCRPLMLLFVVLTLGLLKKTTTEAFTFVQPPSTSSTGFRQSTAFSRSSRLDMTKTQLNEIDSMCILNTANYCVENECPVDDVSALVNQLEDQRDILASQLDTLTTFLEKIGIENQKDESKRDVDQLRAFMTGIANTFAPDQQQPQQKYDDPKKVRP